MPLTRYLAPLLFGLIGAGILVGLGIWQLQRLDWKESVLAQIESRIAADPEPLPQVVDPEAQRYQPVQLSGEFLPGALRVLVSQKQVGAGYRLISPFRTDDGRVVLLDRGFIPVAQKDLTPGTGPALVQGNLHWPRRCRPSRCWWWRAPSPLPIRPSHRCLSPSPAFPTITCNTPSPGFRWPGSGLS